MTTGAAATRFPLATEWRGREAYATTWAYQLACQRARRDDPAGTLDRLILVEHAPVVTLGKQGDMANLRVAPAPWPVDGSLAEEPAPPALVAAGIGFHRVERGGDITYHGPGQLVGYPIVSLRQRGLALRDFMRGLEDVLILTLAEYGLPGERIPGLTGVWVDAARPGLQPAPAKLAAVGVAVQGGVSYHGFALNVAPDLSHFGYIVPCGISDKPVGSMASLLAPQAAPSLDEVRASVERQFRAVFGYAE